jgi:hypothetical protein
MIQLPTQYHRRYIMKVYTYNPTAPCIALARVGKVRGLTVEFNNGTDVTFTRRGVGYELSRIRDNYDLSLFMFSSSVDELSHDENVLLVAAMMLLNITSVKVGSEVITLGASTGIIHTVIIDTAQPQPVRHATNWDTAEEFAVSGHRNQSTPRYYSRRPMAEPIRLPTTKKGWFALGVATVIIGVATAAAAAAADK